MFGDDVFCGGSFDDFFNNNNNYIQYASRKGITYVKAVAPPKLITGLTGTVLRTKVESVTAKGNSAVN